MNPLEPNELLQVIQQDLEPWLKLRQASFSLAGDPGEVLEALADAPQKFRVVLAWAGDEDQTGQPEAGIVDNTFEVWIIKAKGLRLNAGEHLVKGNPPFLSIVSDVRARLRSLAFPSDETNFGRMLYKGAKPFPNPEMAFELPTSGYVLRFELTAAIPFCDLR